MTHNSSPAHFNGKEALGHVAQVQATGIMATAEIHGSELPGHLYALFDSIKQTAIVLLLAAILFEQLHQGSILLLFLFGVSFSLWQTARSAFLGWAYLERKHRVVEQERWEVQHHRKQEKEELKELYRAKGLEGKLLDDVIDVLMADEERLLRVMVEEELCLKLESQDHPLIQAAGALAGSVTALGISCAIFWLDPFYLWFSSGILVAIAAAAAAHYVGNARIPAVIWNVAIALFAALTLFFLSAYLTGI